MAKQLAKFVIKGVGCTINPTAWSLDGDVLWNRSRNLIDNFAICETLGGGILFFDVMNEIEAGWVFGFVQVSVGGGMT